MSYVMSKMPFRVLLAEDSEHDIRATRRVWEKRAIPNPLHIVRDGAECMDYLLREGPYADASNSPRPGVLILDLNLPKLTGFEILERIRTLPALRRLPVVILTTSNRDEDIARAYELGANAFLTKPVGVEKLAETLLRCIHFWEIAGLPDEHKHHGA